MSAPLPLKILFTTSLLGAPYAGASSATDSVFNLCQHATQPPENAQTLAADPYESFQTGCNNLAVAQDNGSADTALLSLTPDEVTAQHTLVVQSNELQRQTVQARLRQYQHSGDAASGEQNFSRLGVFALASRADFERELTSLEQAYDLDNDNQTVGVDYRFSERWLAGVAYGRSDQVLNFTDHPGRLQHEADNFLLYSTWFKNGFYADLLLGYVDGEIVSEREIAASNSSALGQAGSTHGLFSLAGNYDFHEGAWTYGPFARFDASRGVIDAYAETAVDGWGASIEKQDIQSRVMRMGFNASYAFSTGAGVFTPYARASVNKEFRTYRDAVAGQFVLDPEATRFTIDANENEQRWYEASLGMAATLPYGFSLFADYEQWLDLEARNLNSFTLGGRWEIKR